jgi:hypothetical protein
VISIIERYFSYCLRYCWYGGDFEVGEPRKELGNIPDFDAFCMMIVRA